MRVEYVSSNSPGDKFSAEYYLKDSYVGYNSNFKNEKEIIIGTKFKKNKGGVHINLDLGASRLGATLLLILD